MFLKILEKKVLKIRFLKKNANKNTEFTQALF
jgi:hypothetical protein